MIGKLISSPIAWLQEHLSSRPERRVFEEERLVVDATEQIIKAMDGSGMSRAELARLLETSRANVTQLLDGRRNLTLRTLARIAFELDHRVEMSLRPLEEYGVKPLDLSEPVIYWTPEFVSHSEDQIDLLVADKGALEGDMSAIGTTGEYPLAA